MPIGYKVKILNLSSPRLSPLASKREGLEESPGESGESGEGDAGGRQRKAGSYPPTGRREGPKEE